MNVPVILGAALCLTLVSLADCHRRRCDGQYMCENQRKFSKPTCIDKNKLCDGTSNCPLSDDENDCPNIGGCGSLPTISNGTYEIQYGDEEIGSIGGLKCDERGFGFVDIIRCEPGGTWTAVSNITCDGQITDIRLANGPTAREGRLEVFINGIWGTVCNDQIEQNNNGATVVCRMLGFDTDNVTVVNQVPTRYGQGNAPIWLDNVVCAGSETSLSECAHDRGTEVINCDNDEDVGVICG